MKNLNDSYYERGFSHIYVEKEILDSRSVKEILNHFQSSVIIEIDHYKDVFNRSGQNFRVQKQAKNLILARKRGTLVYSGAPVCQSFDNQHFYYTSSVMNCIYDCEYCYLQGMYPSANLVVFLNLEDIFREVELLLKQHPVYLCVSYDTDLLALESILSYGQRWVDFTRKNQNLTIEIRTKSANLTAWKEVEPVERVIYAFTLSPDEVVRSYEKYTPSLTQRIQCIQTLVKRGYRVRLCFDPMLYVPDFKKVYGTFFQQIKQEIPWEQIVDASIGTFRVSEDYLKKMRRQNPKSAILQFPYDNEQGVYHYSKELVQEMQDFAWQNLKEKMPEDKLFLWNPGN